MWVQEKYNWSTSNLPILEQDLQVGKIWLFFRDLGKHSYKIWYIILNTQVFAWQVDSPSNGSMLVHIAVLTLLPPSSSQLPAHKRHSSQTFQNHLNSNVHMTNYYLQKRLLHFKTMSMRSTDCIVFLNHLKLFKFTDVAKQFSKRFPWSGFWGEAWNLWSKAAAQTGG